MSDLYWLSEAQVERLRPYFPKSHGKPRVDDRRVLSGIIYIQRNGLMWKHAPRGLWSAEDPLQPLEAMEPHGRVRHHHDRTGGPGAGHRDGDDRRDPSEGAPDGLKPAVQKGGRGRLIGRTKGGLNSKLHVLADAKGRPIHMFLSAGQTSDYIGARALLPTIPQAGALLADRGYDADWFRNALIELGISPCIPSRLGRKVQIPHDAALYRLRHKIENMFARLKDWRRVATRYDRCPILFLSACALAAIVIYWL